MPLVFAPGGRTTPPPNIREDVVDAWAHCNNPRCEGYGQRPVRAVRTIVEHTVGSRGGDGIFAMVVENTNEYLRFADETEIPCEHCGRERSVTLQERPEIPVLSGFPQDGLLGAAKFDPAIKFTVEDQAHAEEMAEMRREMAELKAMLKGQDDAAG